MVGDRIGGAISPLKLRFVGIQIKMEMKINFFGVTEWARGGGAQKVRKKCESALDFFFSCGVEKKVRKKCESPPFSRAYPKYEV